MELLQVSENKRFLMQGDGRPFFWLADTAWELFHRLNREEAKSYLKTRARQGFNVIQSVALAEKDGLRVGNAYGRVPLRLNSAGEYDPTKPDLAPEGEYDYWDHVDYIVDTAASVGLYIGFLPTWGDKFNAKWGIGPEIFTLENARQYGQWLGRRYRERKNIIWIVGGDRPLETKGHFQIVEQMALGLREGDGGAHPITFHPTGERSSSLHVHLEPWLDFNMIQSGHRQRNGANYNLITTDYEKEPIKPTLDGEPRYEDHPVNFQPAEGYFDAADVRQAAYWSVFAGGAGVTYGHHSVWSMTTEPSDYFIMDYRQALTRPGAAQMNYLRRLMESRPYFERIPDQSLIVTNYEGANHVRATRGQAYAFLYLPNGLPVKVKMGVISGETVIATWYDPRQGISHRIGELPNAGISEFVPPSSGRAMIGS